LDESVSEPSTTTGCREIRVQFQVSLMDAPLVKIITIYEPNPNEWIHYKKRR